MRGQYQGFPGTLKLGATLWLHVPCTSWGFRFSCLICQALHLGPVLTMITQACQMIVFIVIFDIIIHLSLGESGKGLSQVNVQETCTMPLWPPKAHLRDTASSVVGWCLFGPCFLRAHSGLDAQ